MPGNPTPRLLRRSKKPLGYRVITEATAKQDALDYAAYVMGETKASAPALRWLSALEQSIEALSEMPRRYAQIAEQEHFPIELRQFVHYSHRVIYHVNDETSTVHILRIYHGRRDEMEQRDIFTDF